MALFATLVITGFVIASVVVSMPMPWIALAFSFLVIRMLEFVREDLLLPPNQGKGENKENFRMRRGLWCEYFKRPAVARKRSDKEG
jgi:hypothetical protein